MGRRARVLAAALACMLAPRVAAAHTGIQRTSPANGDTVRAEVREVRMRFTRGVETSLTTLVLRRGGQRVPAGSITTVGTDAREFVLPLSQPLTPGAYEAEWRTAGADGHVLTGRFRFVVEAGPAGLAAPPSAAAAEDAKPPQEPEPVAEEAASDAARPLAVAVRWGWFLALLGMIGTVAFRHGVLRRLERDPDLRDVAARGEYGAWVLGWGMAAVSALTLLGRLWLQVRALGGSDRPWEGPQLDMLLTSTGWGLAWVLQALATVGFVTGLLVARAPHGRSAGWMGAAVAAVLLAAVPALSGHAASAARWAAPAIISDWLHVLSAGVWLGTLAVVLAVGLPAALSVRPAAGDAIARMVGAFSPMALAAGGVVGTTGLISAWVQLGTPANLWGTYYGRMLLLKLALLIGVAAMGFYNWRRVLPRLGDETGAARLRRSARAEVGLGALVVLVTAVLVALPTP
ncbi:MAG TPA: CopD family protein [Longimicrobium sp.]|nr:CopD family protein [Longimicrobium sp.]